MFFHWSLDNYLEHGELPIYVNSVSPGEQLSNELHDHGQCVELALITGGSGIHWQTPCTATVKKGDVLLMQKKVSHGYLESETLELKNIVFQPSHLSLPSLDTADMPFFKLLFGSSVAAEPEKTVAPILHLEGESFTRINGLFEKIRQEFDSSMPGRQFIMLALLMEVLLELSRLYMPADNPLRHSYVIGGAIAYMHKNYDKVISMEQIGKAAGISRRNLFRYFKTLLNCTPLTYLTRLRLQKVLDLLSQSDMNLSEIALRCGFCDSNYLSKQFAAEYGISPGRWRQKIRMNRKNLSGDK